MARRAWVLFRHARFLRHDVSPPDNVVITRNLVQTLLNVQLPTGTLSALSKPTWPPTSCRIWMRAL